MTRLAWLASGSARTLSAPSRNGPLAKADSFPGLPANAFDRSEDVIRWSALGERCEAARGVRGIREMSVITGIPQYRVRAIERGRVSEIHPALTQRYFRYLGIKGWVEQWCRARRELAQRSGLQ